MPSVFAQLGRRLDVSEPRCAKSRTGWTSVPGWVAAAPYLWIPLAYLVVLLVMSRLHDTFDEWGGVMQFFAGHELLSGHGYRGWASHFWPPLFPILIALGGALIPPFLAGKLISIAASALTVLITYPFAIRISGDRRVALWSQAFLAVSPLYTFESIRAHNHLLEPLFLVAGVCLSLESGRDRTIQKQALAGVLSGLAALARYTSYILLVLPCLLLVQSKKEGRWRAVVLAGAFWAGFTVISLPWWYENAETNGSPFATWEALNVCSAVVTTEPHTLRSLWWCSDQPSAGLLDIALAHPVEYLRNVKGNIAQSIAYLAKSTGILAPFAIAGVFWALFLVGSADWSVLFGTLAAYIVLVSQSQAQDRYFLAWIPLMTIVSVSLLVSYLDRCKQRFGVFARHRLSVGLMILLWIGGAWLTARAVTADLREERSATPLAEIQEVARTLQEYDPDLSHKTIMATEPMWAYYAGSRYLAAPLIYVGSVEELVTYRGISARGQAFAPRYPADMSDLRADYLVHTKLLPDPDPPQFSFLLDPGSNRIPEYFALVYRSPNTVVYKIDWNRAALPAPAGGTPRPDRLTGGGLSPGPE